MTKLTQKQATRFIRAQGASVRVSNGEYRVNVPGGTELTAYYTDDADDAVNTAAQMMRRHHERFGLFGA